jgi:hypothetical protein
MCRLHARIKGIPYKRIQDKKRKKRKEAAKYSRMTIHHTTEADNNNKRSTRVRTTRMEREHWALDIDDP